MIADLVFSAWILTDEERAKGKEGRWRLYEMRQSDFAGMDLCEMAREYEVERALRILVANGTVVREARVMRERRRDPEPPRHPWYWRRSSKHGVGRKARHGRKNRFPVSKAGELA